MPDEVERVKYNFVHGSQFVDDKDDDSVFSADGCKSKKKKKKKTPPIRVNLSNCKYEVLRIIQRKLGWREVGDDEDWEIYWTDTSVSIERIMKLTRTQKINHFNGMLEICRKKSMARNLQKMQKIFPEQYDFFPRTFLLPNDQNELLRDSKEKGKKQIYILKPDAGCQGKGIRLLQGGKEEVILRAVKEMDTPNVVAQHYLPAPYLINGFKFDLRIYALVLSCDPLRIFVYNEGLVRFCTEKYVPPKASNLSCVYMHLTNYAVNKHNENFIANENSDDGDGASKWYLAQLRQHIEKEGHSWQEVWESIHTVICKSLISIQPVLRNNYRSVLPPDNDGFSCFEVLGYDIMLDSILRPWLIEVNHSPSFSIDSALDLTIKEALITDTIQLVRVDPHLINKALKAERKATTGRLLAPVQRKGSAAAPHTGPQKVNPASQGPAAAAAAREAAEKEAAAKKLSSKHEAWEAKRAKALQLHEAYEQQNAGGFQRIFPCDNAARQALYDELLRGAAELFAASFASRAKKVLENVEETKKKDPEVERAEQERKQRARLLRDRLAEAWKLRHLTGVAQPSNVSDPYSQPRSTAVTSNGMLVAIAGEQPRSEVAGEEEIGAEAEHLLGLHMSDDNTRDEPETSLQQRTGSVWPLEHIEPIYFCTLPPRAASSHLPPVPASASLSRTGTPTPGTNSSTSQPFRTGGGAPTQSAPRGDGGSGAAPGPLGASSVWPKLVTSEAALAPPGYLCQQGGPPVDTGRAAAAAAATTSLSANQGHTRLARNGVPVDPLETALNQVVAPDVGSGLGGGLAPGTQPPPTRAGTQLTAGLVSSAVHVRHAVDKVGHEVTVEHSTPDHQHGGPMGPLSRPASARKPATPATSTSAVSNNKSCFDYASSRSTSSRPSSARSRPSSATRSRPPSASSAIAVPPPVRTIMALRANSASSGLGPLVFLPLQHGSEHPPSSPQTGLRLVQSASLPQSGRTPGPGSPLSRPPSSPCNTAGGARRPLPNSLSPRGVSFTGVIGQTSSLARDGVSSDGCRTPGYVTDDDVDAWEEDMRGRGALTLDHGGSTHRLLQPLMPLPFGMTVRSLGGKKHTKPLPGSNSGRRSSTPTLHYTSSNGAANTLLYASPSMSNSGAGAAMLALQKYGSQTAPKRITVLAEAPGGMLGWHGSGPAAKGLAVLGTRVGKEVA